MTPVKMQVGGSCVAFANTAALESQVIIAGHATASLDLSERAVAEINSGYPSSVSEFIESTGVPPESCFSYAGGPTAVPQEGWREQTYRITSHTGHRSVPLEHLKADIAEHGPVVANMNVPQDFFYYGGGVYTATTTQRAEGFHEVVVVGYDDADHCFVIKNSWGAGWGEGGFCRIDYSQYLDGNCHFAWGFDTFHGVIPPRRHVVVPVALRTVDGHALTLADGGGLGDGTTALTTDRFVPGPWETFGVEWLDTTVLALRTHDGHYVTAVHGGGMGGPNDATCPVHTDATWVGPWEQLTLTYDPLLKTATLQTPRGRFVSAVNGGGVGGPDNVPIHTDATAIGPWERFTAVVTHFSS